MKTKYDQQTTDEVLLASIEQLSQVLGIVNKLVLRMKQQVEQLPIQEASENHDEVFDQGYTTNKKSTQVH